MSNYITPELNNPSEITVREKSSPSKGSLKGKEYSNLTEATTRQPITSYTRTERESSEQTKLLSESKKTTSFFKEKTTAHSDLRTLTDSESIYSEPNLTDDFFVGLSDSNTSEAISSEFISSEELESEDSPKTQTGISYDEPLILTDRSRKPKAKTTSHYDEPPILTDHSRKPKAKTTSHYDEPPILTDRSRKSERPLNSSTDQRTPEKIQRSPQEKLARAKSKIFSAIRTQAGSDKIASTFVGSMLRSASSQPDIVRSARKPLSSDYIGEALEGHYFPNDPAVVEARKAWLQAEGDESFEEWLSTQPEICKQLSSVKYLNKDERKEYKVDIQNGQLIRNQRPYGTTKESTVFSGRGSAIFVLSGDQELYAGSHIAGQFHHSSFLSGQPVLAAGELKSNDKGTLVAISNKSGHYKPTATENITMLNYIKDRGVNLGSVVYDEVLPSNIICRHKTAEIYLNSNGQALPSEMSDKNFHIAISYDESGGITLRETRNNATAEHTKVLHRVVLNTLKAKGADLDKITFIRHSGPEVTNCKEYLAAITPPRQ